MAQGKDGRGALGRRGEDAGAAYLERVGMRVLERNWRCKAGEIDIVAADGAELVLCEVKTRKSVRSGLPEEAVGETKQRRLARVAREYVARMDPPPDSVRFDVVTLLVLAPDRALLRHHRAAFVIEER